MADETILKEGVEPNNTIKPAFTTKYLDEEKEDTGNEIITLRLNKEDREFIDELKFLMSYGQDAKILKKGIRVLHKVIHSTFGAELFLEITEERRRRPVSKYKLVDGKVSKL